MSAFDAAINALYADPNLGADAVYTPASGIARAVRLLREPQPLPQEYGPFETRAVAPAYAAEVRSVEIAQPADGDTVSVGGQTFKVRSAQPDGQKLVWRLNLDKVS